MGTIYSEGSKKVYSGGEDSTSMGPTGQVIRKTNEETTGKVMTQLPLYPFVFANGYNSTTETAKSYSYSVYANVDANDKYTKANKNDADVVTIFDVFTDLINATAVNGEFNQPDTGTTTLPD
jgi:hypothetical protein